MTHIQIVALIERVDLLIRQIGGVAGAPRPEVVHFPEPFPDVVQRPGQLRQRDLIPVEYGLAEA